MFIITHGVGFRPERSWILSILFKEFLGLDYITIEKDIDHVRIEYSDRVLEVSDHFFRFSKLKWMKPSSLPRQPLTVWDTNQLPWDINLVHTGLPIIFGQETCEVSEKNVRIGLDIFGSSFFMLSLYEEVVKKDRDNYDRFPSLASLAYQENFLHRPIVNEYLEILWSTMKHLWPGLARKQNYFSMHITADVDQPYSCGIKNPITQVRQLCGDLIKRKNLPRAFRSSVNYFRSKRGDYSFDPYYSNFEWMMTVNEAAGNRMVFYFIAGHSDAKMDGCYSLDEPVIRHLMRTIHNRGHEIGVHPSFSSYRNSEQMCTEVGNIKKVMEEEKIFQKELGGRQHYLRWKSPYTACNLENSGLNFDSSLSFADHAGFRCGCCFEYTFYDIVHRKPFSFRERPLILMESSVIESQYMGYGYTDIALDTMKSFRDTCKKFRGNFILLWHNSSFDNKQSGMMYRDIIGRN